jgi:4-amino-4-deoxy-L-arabinose transferase-like glycosyltransferase
MSARTVLLSVSVVFALAALMAFEPLGRGDWGWTLHALSLFLLLAALAPMQTYRRLLHGPYSLDCVSLRAWASGIALALILIAALAVRVWRSDSIPPGLWFDEAREGVVAQHIVSDPSYRPFFIEYMDRPAQHPMFTALLFSVFGSNVPALRLGPALFGVLNVLAAFLLFRRWLGLGGGLIAAALLAVMRYEITFSRIVFDANTVPFFIMLTLFFLDRGLEQRRALDFVLAGLTLGIGLSFYLPMRLFAIFLVALAFAVALVIVMRARSFAPLKPWALYAAWLLIGFLFAAAPLVEFALTSPDIYFSRNESVSILNEHRDPNIAVAIWNSAVSHLAMFHLQGDRNARHNLPGAPMLDPISGSLLLLGVSLSLRRDRSRATCLMLLVSAVMLQAGILSTEWDAPQAVRSIGVIPGVLYFLTLAVVVLQSDLARLLHWHQTHRPGEALSTLVRFAPNLLPIALLLPIAALNLDVYFNQQAVNREVWLQHSPDDTWMAQEMNRLGPTHDVVLAADLRDSPTIQFMAPGITVARLWTSADHLPLPPGNGRPTVMLLNSTLAATVDEARRLNPAAVIKELRPPGGGPVIVYEIILDR